MRSLFLASLLTIFALALSSSNSLAAPCVGQGNVNVLTSDPLIGGTWNFTVQAGSNLPVYIVVSPISASQAVPGLGTVCIDLNSSTILLQGTTSGTGMANVSIPIPNDPGLLNLTFYFQVAVFDPAAPNGVALSDRMVLEIRDLNTIYQNSAFVSTTVEPQMSVRQGDAVFYNGNLGSVYNVTPAGTFSTPYGFLSGRGMAVADFSAMGDQIYIGRLNQGIWYKPSYPTAGNLVQLIDNFDFGTASGIIFGNNVTEIAINLFTSHAIFYDDASHIFLTFGNFPFGSPSGDLFPHLFPSGVQTITGSSNNAIADLTTSSINSYFYFIEKNSDTVIRGDLFAINGGPALAVSKAQVMNFTKLTNADLTALATDGLDLYLFDQISGRLMKVHNQEFSTLLTISQLPGALRVERLHFDPVASALYLVDNLGRVSSLTL